MIIEFINREPFIKINIKNFKSWDIECLCLVDTWFSWSMAIPYFLDNNNSLISKIDLFANTTKLLDQSNWIETASWISRTYTSTLLINIDDQILDSEIFIYEHLLWYSNIRDFFIIWIKFFEDNKKILNFDFLNKEFTLK